MQRITLREKKLSAARYRRHLTLPPRVFTACLFVLTSSGAGESRAVEQDKDRRGRPETEVRRPEAAPVGDKKRGCFGGGGVFGV